MNWPNRLSLIRIASVPFITLLLVLNGYAWTGYAALFWFILAAITDFVDGHIARKYNLVTNFGKFIDPVADKLLVLSTMVMLSWHGLLPAWIVVAVLFRELAVDGLRLVAVEQGRVIAAGKLGKLKTTFQMIMIIVLVLNFDNYYIHIFGIILIVVATSLTIISLIDYIVKNKDVLKETK